MNASARHSIATLLFALKLITMTPAAYSQDQIISASCGKAGIVTLKISDKSVEKQGMPSAIRLMSTLKSEELSPLFKGSTSIFYAGQSAWFSSFDNKVIFNVTRGHGASREIDKAVLETEQGSSSCIGID